MTIEPRHKPYLALALLAVVLGLAFQGTRGLFDTSEGRYAECTREMVETGNWLEPQLNYEPHWTKPPPTYWAIAAGIMLLGQNEWGVRLYGAATFVVSVLAVAALGGAMWDRRTGLVAGLIYATSPFAIGASNVVTADCLLAMWTLLAVLAYWKATRAAGSRAAGFWIVAMWLALALGFATKGPPALLVLIPIIVVRLWPAPPESPRTRILSPVALAVSALVGLTIFTVVGLGWYAWAAATHPGLLDT
ncbi:MAG: phospholipid carrier-dependent glycosyltransferase, partial [Planctomycetes bacterium]|nr:phospholipid carrier-dependent glycosyltransferase [Planctomycetota bacterium]